MLSVSSAELSAMRSAVEGLMPDTCNILSVTRASDGQGGLTDTWGTATANVACRLDNYSGVGNREDTAGAALQAFHGYILSVPYDTTITELNRIEVDSDTFAVVSVDKSKSWDACLRCYLERV